MTPPVVPAPVTPSRIELPNSSVGIDGPGHPSIRASTRYLSPSKRRQLMFGTPPVVRTPSRAPPPPRVVTPRNEAIQLPDPPQLPELIIGKDPELRGVLSNHLESLDRLIDRYSQLKLGLAHSLNAQLADAEHERTNAKCELAVLQKQFLETSEANERLKQELNVARARSRQMTDDRRGMELKLSELRSFLSECQKRSESLQRKKSTEKKELGEFFKQAREELKFLEQITGMRVSVGAGDFYFLFFFPPTFL
ncbi:hypothetical protein BY996DRAFT_7420925 [Phakopsora pachyrhizi]|nr:hypothetical protein BY996DRAFT_7420925 [Phakopsora pachyrhizi]